MRRLLYIVLIAIVALASASDISAQKRRAAKKNSTEQTARKSSSKTTGKNKKTRTSGDVRREQRRTAQEIEKAQQQINSNTRETRRQLNNLASLEAEIGRSTTGIDLLQARVDSIGRRVSELGDSISAAESQLSAMRGAYARSLQSMRRRRTKVSTIAFVLGAGSLNEAYRRTRYLRELSAAHAAKARRVRAAADRLAHSREVLADVLAQQKRELTQLSVARNVLRDKQQRADTLVASLRREGAGLKRALAEKQRQARALDQELDRIIAEEQRRAEEERRRAEAAAAAKAKAEAEARAKAQAEKAAKGSTAQTTTPEPTPAPTNIPAESSAKKPDVAYNTAASDRALSGSFASNKGRLLFPVAGQYRIVSGFGRTKHPRVPGLEIQNSGIDIEAAGQAHARAVFDGEVSSVFRIDGYQNIVILRHGEYLTVYAGLDQIAVRKGDKVKASQRLGHIYSDPDDGGRSVLHFELRHERTKLNPSDWVR